MKCGLLGHKLGHSYSPQIHGYLGSYSYTLFEKEPEELESFLKYSDFSGINVTIPYKKSVIAYLDELSPAAQKIGAVNTIIRKKNGSLYGHNTDYYGFLSMLHHSGISVKNKKVLVLGSGGASSTVIAVLQELGANAIVISRTGENNYTNLSRHADASVIVNTTPVGMYPMTGETPLDLSAFSALEGVLDVIYNPARTKLLMDAQKLGIPCENGLWMLVAQAKEAAEYFTGSEICESKIEAIHKKLSAQMMNIVLVGMPGSGKSTIAALLSKALGRSWADSDQIIEKMSGKTIPEIFHEDGETVFRDWETKALTELGKQSGLILSTGGGCITQSRNYPLLHQNGKIFWLKRSISSLSTDGRPLSQAGSLETMYAQRKPMYQYFADHIIDNNGCPDMTVREIIAHLEEKA